MWLFWISQMLLLPNGSNYDSRPSHFAPKNCIHHLTDPSFTMVAYGKKSLLAAVHHMTLITLFGQCDNWLQSPALFLAAWDKPCNCNGTWCTITIRAIQSSNNLESLSWVLVSLARSAEVSLEQQSHSTGVVFLSSRWPRPHTPSCSPPSSPEGSMWLLNAPPRPDVNSVRLLHAGQIVFTEKNKAVVQEKKKKTKRWAERRLKCRLGGDEGSCRVITLCRSVTPLHVAHISYLMLTGKYWLLHLSHCIVFHLFTTVGTWMLLKRFIHTARSGTDE